MTLLYDMNYFEHPDAKESVFVVRGRHGELYVTVRVGEAWELWAETNGYKKEDWGKFADDFEDQIEWSSDGRRGFLDEGGTMECVDIIGYYRDGDKNL